MNQVPHIPAHVKDLIDQALNGTIDAEGLYRLDAALLDNPEIQAYFLDYCQLFMDLTVETRADQVIESFRARKDRIIPAIAEESAANSKATLATPVRALSFSQAWWVLGVPACLLFLLGSWFGWYTHARNANQQTVVKQPAPAVAPAAYLMSANGCNWSGRPEIYTVGSEVQPGDEISLSEGVAEFRLANGVYVSVEGPASLVLMSASTLVLQYGKITSHVPWAVTDFKTLAGACKLTSRESEFGVTYDGGRVELHVFSGAVKAESPQAATISDGMVYEEGSLVVDESGKFTSGTITSGNALSLKGSGNTLKMADVPGQKAQPEKFAAKLPMAGALPITKEYVDAVLASKPLGYWRFETAKDGMFLNEIEGGSQLEVVGDVRLAGRVGNTAVEFHPNSKAHLKSDSMDELTDSDYSAEIWMKASHFHHGVVMSLYAHRAVPKHGTTIEVMGATGIQGTKSTQGKIRYVHTSLGNIKTSCFSKRDYCIRRWQHVVAAKEGARMRLYIDGKLAASDSDSTHLASDIRLVLGWFSKTPERCFVGQLDEAVIYNRALSSEEVKRHYRIVEKAVRLPPEDKSAANNASWVRGRRKDLVASANLTEICLGDSIVQ